MNRGSRDARNRAYNLSGKIRHRILKQRRSEAKMEASVMRNEEQRWRKVRLLEKMFVVAGW